MKSILIVDDEKFIRQGISTIVRRLNIFDKIYEAQNGKEALDIMTQNSIEILMTDIKMPIIDGIELIRLSTNLKKKPKVIILSGYDDFVYAKEAITNKVSAYLLKPIDRDELNETIMRLLDEIDVERKNQERQEKANELISNVVANELNFIFLHNNIKNEEVELILNNLKLDIFEKPYYLSIIMPLKPNADLSYLDRMAYEQQCEQCLCIKNTHDNYMLITNNRPTDEIINNLNSKQNMAFVQGVSMEHQSNLSEAYKQAEDALKYRIISEKSILYYEDFAHRQSDYVVSDRDFDKILNMLHANRYKEALNLLGELFEDNSYTIDYYESCANALYTNVLEHFPGYNISELKDIYNFESKSEYLTAVTNHILKLANAKDATDSFQSKGIDIALQYINDNYHKDLTLAMVSNHVSLSYSYFSLVFKEKTGFCFTDYLKKIRILKAKELLKNTDKKIYVISEMVGYENPKQFMKMFRKETGISPSEFREL